MRSFRASLVSVRKEKSGISILNVSGNTKSASLSKVPRLLVVGLMCAAPSKILIILMTERDGLMSRGDPSEEPRRRSLTDLIEAIPFGF